MKCELKYMKHVWYKAIMDSITIRLIPMWILAIVVVDYEINNLSDNIFWIFNIGVVTLTVIGTFYQAIKYCNSKKVQT